MSFDSESVRKIINNALKKKHLTIADVEKRSGLSRSSLYNFLCGRVREPRLDVILAAAKTLELEPAEIFDLAKQNFDKKIESNSNNCDLALLLECSQGVIEALIKRDRTASPDKIFAIIQKVYEYSKKYSGQKLDAAFVEWSIDNDT
jgi:transcriptional regulator with XRE-family HTH domain